LEGEERKKVGREIKGRKGEKGREIKEGQKRGNTRERIGRKREIGSRK